MTRRVRHFVSTEAMTETMQKSDRGWMLALVTAPMALLTLVFALQAAVDARRQSVTSLWIKSVESQGLQVRVFDDSRVEVEVESAEDVQQMLQLGGPAPHNLSIACGGSVTRTHMTRLEARFPRAYVFWPK
jgi:hypothetical protein